MNVYWAQTQEHMLITCTGLSSFVWLPGKRPPTDLRTVFTDGGQGRFTASRIPVGILGGRARANVCVCGTRRCLIGRRADFHRPDRDPAITKCFDLSGLRSLSLSSTPTSSVRWILTLPGAHSVYAILNSTHIKFTVKTMHAKKLSTPLPQKKLFTWRTQAASQAYCIRDQNLTGTRGFCFKSQRRDG